MTIVLNFLELIFGIAEYYLKGVKTDIDPEDTHKM